MTSSQNPKDSALAVEQQGHPPLHRRQIPLRSTCPQPHHCPRPMRMRILAQIPLFAGLSEDQLDSIDKRMVSLSWAEGDRLYGAGEPAKHLYVVAVGQVKATQSARNGQDAITDILAPGDLFGALSVRTQPVYAETVEALTTTCALRMNTDVFREVLLEHPQVALRVLDDVTALLARARSAASRYAKATVAQRVATTLLSLADKFGQQGASGDGTLIQLPLSRADLARMTASTPESVSRVMSRLREDGVIDSGRRWTSILDRNKLIAIITSDA